MKNPVQRVAALTAGAAAVVMMSAMLVRGAAPGPLMPLLPPLAAPPAPMATSTTSPEAAELRAKVLKAAQETKTYEATVTTVKRIKQGRITSTEESYYKVAMDRAAGKLALDHPLYLVVDDGEKLRLKSDQFAGKHLETAPPAKFDLASLEKALEPLSFGEMPDAIMLLSDDPFTALAENPGAKIKIVPAGADGQAGLSFDDRDRNTWLVRFDPATFLPTTFTLSPDPAMMKPDDEVNVVHTVKITSRNQPLDAKVFAFDTKGSTAVPTLQALAGAGASAVHPLEGKPAPDFTLKSPDGKTTVKLSEVKEKVIVLDFWATWCVPCKESLPHLQAFYDAAKKEKKSLAVFAINVLEPGPDATKFWSEMKLTLPMVLDSDGDVAGRFGVSGFPHSVIISGGKVQKVIVGYNKALSEQMEEEVIKALSGPAQ